MYESQCLYGTKIGYTLESGSKIPLKGMLLKIRSELENWFLK